jgi:hypothetical protein
MTRRELFCKVVAGSWLAVVAWVAATIVPRKSLWARRTATYPGKLKRVNDISTCSKWRG